MPKFRMRFEREYTITEGFERIIDAPSLAEAEAAAANLCSAFDQDCPDDCTESGAGGPGAGEFSATCVSAEVHKVSDPDYVVLPDGQVVDHEC